MAIPDVLAPSVELDLGGVSACRHGHERPSDLYRRLFAEETRLDKLGGAKKATPELEAILAETMLDQSVADHGAPIRVYSAAKTVTDCFKFRNKIGLDVALEALKDAWRSRKVTMDELSHFA